MSIKNNKVLFACGLLLMLSACTKDYVPKPRGYCRIDFPEKKYTHYTSPNCPFEFDVPVYAEVKKDSNRLAEPCWLYIVFPGLQAQLYFTYKPLNNDLNKYTEESRGMAYKHTVKASGIDEIVINTPHHVHGMVYDIGGNAASNLQFYVTDSVRHFIRGSLYFNAQPQIDSLEPAIKFVRADVLQLVNSLKWK